MNPWIMLTVGCFVGAAVGFRAGVQFMFDKEGKEYLRGYKEALKWAGAQNLRAIHFESAVSRTFDGKDETKP